MPFATRSAIADATEPSNFGSSNAIDRDVDGADGADDVCHGMSSPSGVESRMSADPNT